MVTQFPPFIRCRPGGLATLLLGPLVAGALPAQPIVLDKVEVVAPPVVNATTIDAFASQTTAVGANQIEALNAQDLPSALRRTPGVTIARFNAVGSFGGAEGGSVFLRGLGSSRPGGEIKTTVDGVPKSNATFNHPLLDFMSIDLAAHIEVSRRAAPLAAGNMFAGVNLVSPRATDPGAFARATVAAGSFGTFMEKVETGAKAGTFDAYAGQSYRESDGHRPSSGGRLTNYVLHLGWQPDARWDFHYLVNRTDNRAADPGPLGAAGTAQTRGDVYRTADWLHLLTAAWKFDRAAGSLKFYRDDAEANWLRRTTSGNADSLNDSRLSGVRWRETFRLWEGGELVAGADYDLTRGKSVSVPANPAAANVTFGPREFRLFSAYAGVAHRFDLADRWTLTPSAGVRHYDHDQFGTAWAPQAGVVARRGGTQLHASYGRALNHPGLDVAAFSTVSLPALAASWPLLRPEKLDQFELGFRQELTPDLAAELTLFRNRGLNRYVWQAPPPRYLNLEKFRTQGGEFTLTARAGKTISVFGGGARLDAEPADLPYAPRWSLVGGATWRPLAALTFNLDAAYTGEQRAGAQARTATGVNNDRLGAFALVNARAAYAFTWEPRRRAEVFVAGENLFDRAYTYRPGYPMPGASWSIGLTLAF
jgi:iron complex outermembrane receptor protein